MKRLLILITFVSLVANGYAEVNPEEVVKAFGEALTSWCRTGDISYRVKIDRLCSGAKKCRVEDKIHAEYQAKRGLTDYETFVLDSYMSMFQNLISDKGIVYQMNNVKLGASDMMPDGLLSFVTADITVSGTLNHSVKDLFLVRDGKITGIYSYSSVLGFKHLNGSLINALKLGRYDWTSGFQAGYAKVKNESGHYGLIDLKGNVIVPCIWDLVYYGGNPYQEGGAAFVTCRSMDDKYRATYDLRKNGKRVPLYKTELTNLGSRNLWYVDFSDGWAVVKNEEHKYGFLKEDWSESEYDKIEYIYDITSGFVNGYAYATYKGCGFIFNKRLEYILHDTDKYHIVSNVRDGLVKVREIKTGKYGFMNLSGRIVIPCVYYYAEDFSNGVSFVYHTSIAREFPDKYEGSITLRGPVRMINRYGKILSDCDYYTRYKCFEDGNAPLFKEKEGELFATIVGCDGKPLPGFIWDKYLTLDPLYNGYARFSKDHIYGYLDETGQVAIDLTGKFTHSSAFNNGYACVGIRKAKQEVKYGCINKDGVLVIPCVYDKEFIFREDGIALVQKDGRVGLIDVYGNSTFFEKADEE